MLGVGLGLWRLRLWLWAYLSGLWVLDLSLRGFRVVALDWRLWVRSVRLSAGGRSFFCLGGGWWTFDAPPARHTQSPAYYQDAGSALGLSFQACFFPHLFRGFGFGLWIGNLYRIVQLGT